MAPKISSADLRNRFLSFFKAREHTPKSSDSLIPSGDPTVLFTSAGMNQFKDYFLGRRTDLTRAVSCQKCLRAGDLEHVGKTAGHHSFFEMLGNFSFGNYFKAEAIGWAWEFLTGTLDYDGTQSSTTPTMCLDLKPAKLWVSVYEKDDEAFQLWRTLGVPGKRIKRYGPAENFWPANAPTQGPNGPCGPCSEIYFDPDGKVEGKRSVEVWNLVFTQFDRQPDGSLKPLSNPSIDTGMGLERLTSVVQGVETDYETDLFVPILEEIQRLPHRIGVSPGQVQFAERAVADHLRAMVLLLTDGVVPSNESRGYVLRMLIRRAYRLGRTILKSPAGPPQGFLANLVPAVEQAMRGSPYVQALAAKRDVVRRVIEQEETQFIETLESGTSRLEDLMGRLKKKVIPGEEAFKLYDTYGFPVELTVDIAREHGFTVDRAGFDKAFQAQQARSRAGSQFGGDLFVTDDLRIRESIPQLPEKDAQFVGYDSLRFDATVQGLWDGTAWVPKATEGQSVGVVLNRSPFYGEAGGQIGDAGTLEGPKGRADITKTTWVDHVLLHHAVIRQGTVGVQETVRAQVDPERRMKIARSHTAAHMLHWALRTVLGPETVQAGSFVEAERVRFDFSSRKGMHEEQRAQVEALVNSRVRLVDEISTVEMPLEEAKHQGALALFGEKYSTHVRVVTIGDYSKELCGGTHVRHTGFVGTFLIMGESSIAAGTRRLEALVGDAATQQQHQQQRILHEAAKRLGRPAKDIVKGLDELLDQLKHAERERKTLQAKLATVEAERLVAEGKKINGVTLVTSTIKHADREVLAVMADAVRISLQHNGVVLLASSEGPANVSLVMAATGDLTTRMHVGQMLKAISSLTKGSGGGRPEFAQAGGRDPSGIPAALKKAEELVREALEQS